MFKRVLLTNQIISCIIDDIKSLSTFRAEATTCIKHIHNTKRPMVITQRGKGVAILLDINEYESLQEKIELLQDVYKAEKKIKLGEVSSHTQAQKNILKKLKNGFPRFLITQKVYANFLQFISY